MEAVVEEAEKRDLPARIKRSHQLRRDFQLLGARSATLCADIRALIGQSSSLIRHSRYLAPRPIHGGTDDTGLVTAVLASGIAICAECLAGKTGIPMIEIPSAIAILGKTVYVHTPDAPCHVCLTTREVYQLGTPTERPQPLPPSPEGASAKRRRHTG